jgi:hypothetical protein
MREAFPYVRVFHCFWGWGYHFVASNDPILNRTAAQLAQGMPGKAVEDLTEWGPQPTADGEFASILNRELSLDQMIAEAPNAPAMHDDWPANEYYALRQQLSPAWSQYLLSQQHGGPVRADR